MQTICCANYTLYLLKFGGIMEELLVKIGELIATEIDEVKEISYVDKEMGSMFYICLNDGRKVLLSLINE